MQAYYLCKFNLSIEILTFKIIVFEKIDYFNAFYVINDTIFY